MGGMSLSQHTGTPADLHLGPPVVHIVGGQQAEPSVTMLGVVPPEEVPAEAATVLDRSEPIGKARPVLHRLEMCLRVRMFRRRVRPPVRVGLAHVRQELGNRIGYHRRTPVGWAAGRSMR